MKTANTRKPVHFYHLRAAQRVIMTRTKMSAYVVQFDTKKKKKQHQKYSTFHWANLTRTFFPSYL